MQVTYKVLIPKTYSRKGDDYGDFNIENPIRVCKDAEYGFIKIK